MQKYTKEEIENALSSFTNEVAEDLGRFFMGDKPIGDYLNKLSKKNKGILLIFNSKDLRKFAADKISLSDMIKLGITNPLKRTIRGINETKTEENLFTDREYSDALKEFVKEATENGKSKKETVKTSMDKCSKKSQSVLNYVHGAILFKLKDSEITIPEILKDIKKYIKDTNHPTYSNYPDANESLVKSFTQFVSESVHNPEDANFSDVLCYDSGSFDDRYTLFKNIDEQGSGVINYLGVNAGGGYYHGEIPYKKDIKKYENLGKKVKFEDLPKAVQNTWKKYDGEYGIALNNKK